ncbi:hypothetical protein CAL12_23225 [Bordetella genomosp. 8]|uniref:Protoporphyrinogen IX oxidase n=1 Tax=Bordetella genomosp. 8 TaxID=1416806 RepID=A0A1W6YR16_9BORD|nr:CopD family protein [Bordetella genomosp. 8]ARP83441.1 hypothetical protein CAL12_23225 [Bordetella genomosp. 8]
MDFAILYTWTKILHVTAAFVFVAGISVVSLMLIADPPDAPDAAGAAARTLRWHRVLATPAMILTWILGIALAVQGHWLGDGWLHGKLALVVLLSAIHGIQARTLRRRAAGRHAAMWRITPLVVAMAVIAILALVVVKPF